ncbi:MAG TPA: PDZ domain-containing protein [Saprospiraceae bacterium]|nr:PDZ domain-containing protein [Saprospiraceae bacterium]
MNSGKETRTKKLNIWLPLLFSLVLVGGMYVGTKLQSSSVVNVRFEGDHMPSNIGHGRIEELIRYIEARYVDEVNGDELVEKAINALLGELDPHSSYIPARELKEVNEQLEGNFEGVGIEFMVLEDTILVVSPIAGGPSEAVGIMAGDKIIEIMDTIVIGKGLAVRDIVSKLRGKKGSKVKLGIQREGEAELIQFTVTRDRIPMNSVDVSYMLDAKTGYIKINRFSASTYKEFMQGLEELVEKYAMKDLVIDLRQNPGGYLQEATNLLSQLFDEKGKLLVYTQGKSVHRNEYKTTGKNFYQIGKIAILTDGGSASASEIVAGAIQDWDRGVIVGRRTFGKGLVQEQYDLKDGAALRLTIARYYTPSGRCIQKSYNDKEAYDHDLLDRYDSGELYSVDSIHVADSTKYFTSGGRVVFGGGGIIPDVFVPLDTIQLNKYFIALRQHVPEFVFREYEKNKGELELSLKDFSRNYQIDDKMINAFIQYTETKKIKAQPEELNKIRPTLKRLMKARLAKHLFGDIGFYTIWNRNDDVVKEAMQVLHKDDPISASKE